VEEVTVTYGTVTEIEEGTLLSPSRKITRGICWAGASVAGIMKVTSKVLLPATCDTEETG
jgi:hypothetical protein